MNHRVIRILLLITFVSHITSATAADFLLQDGERVVFLGNTLIEREQEYGDWEIHLTLAAGDRHVTFRNLGWSGDTVWADSRGLFDPPAVGYQRTLELIKELKPTTIILGYGAVESQRGPEGLKDFVKQYQKLRQDLLSLDTRLVHLSPLLMESASFPVQSEAASQHVVMSNQNLNLYADAIHKIAAEAEEPFIDFREAQQQAELTAPWLENGVHLSQTGYQATAQVLVEGLGGTFSPLPNPQLRAVVQRKNRLFFHRWRPQNFTYLLGFRKHEQGQNAVEIAQFDPLIEELEVKIHQLKTTAPMTQ